MKNNLSVAAMAAVAMLATGVSFGQGPGVAGLESKAAKDLKGPAPRLPDGHPDFSGLWERPYTPDMTAYGRNQTPDQSLPDEPLKPGGRAGARPTKALPFTPAGKAAWDKYDAANGDYTGSCMPFGLTRSVNSPDPLQIMQNSQYLGLLFEQNTWFHTVRIGGEHAKNLTPTWFGDSVGKWDGDTLVIDTIGFNGRTRLDTNGHPHSAQMHVIERYSRPDYGHINYEITIDDPVTYTKPWKNMRVFTLRPDWQIMEYSCEENNKDFFEGHIKATGDPNDPKAGFTK